MNNLTDYFNKLSEKDQRAFKILAVTLATLILYFAFIGPAFNYYQSSKISYRQNQELLNWINQNASSVTVASTQPSGTSNTPLLQLVSVSAENNKISVSRLQPEGDKRVRIWIANTAFGPLMQWLTTLTRQSGITVASISIDKTNQPGIVNVQCQLAMQ